MKYPLRVLAGAFLALAPVALNAQTLPATTNLVLWLKADAGVTANANNQVTAWADQSGKGNNATQATAASAPVLTPDSLNGKPTLRFTQATAQFMEVPNANEIAQLTNDVTLITVAKFDNLSGYRGVVEKCVAGAPSPFDTWYNASQNGGRGAFWLNAGVDASNQRYNATIPPPVNVYNVLSYRWKNSLVDQFLNDFNIGSEAKATTVSPTNGPTNLRIGRRPDNTVQLVGNLAEILIYKPALSDPDMYAVITQYLQPKYGLVFNLAPTVNIVAPAMATAGSTIPVTVNVSDTDGYVTTVRVSGNGYVLGTATAVSTNSSASYEMNVKVMGNGPLTLTAVATDNYGRPVTSSPTIVDVTGSFPSAPVATGLKLWLNGETGFTTNASGAITQWADQSGAGNHAVQLDETSAPIWAGDAVNGKPVARFTGTAQFLEVSDEGTAFLTNDFSTFAVAKFANSYPAARQHVWSKCSALGWAGPVDWWFNTTTGVPFGYRGDGNFYAGTGGGTMGPPLNRFNAVGMTVTGADGLMNHHLGFADNGFSLALTNTANAGPLRIGRRADNATQIVGDIAEILIYDQALSTADRSNVVAYLSGKYGMVQPSNVSTPPTLAITSPVNGASMAPPATVTFAATASSAQGTIARVILQANGQTFATITTPPYQVPLDLLTPGTVLFTAIAQDNWGLSTTSSVTVTVTGSASTPLVTEGLRVWLAADQQVTTNAAGAVTTWTDLSLAGNNAVATDEATSPKLIPNVYNGKPALRFDGTSQFLEIQSDTSFIAGNISSFVLMKFNNFASFRAIWSKTFFNNLAAPVDWYCAQNTGVPNLFRGNGAAGGYGGFAGGAVPAGVLGVIGFKADGQAITHYLGYNVNGSGTITSPPVDSGAPLRIGRRYDGGVQLNGDIAEILLYDRPVPESERLQIANYLFNKWGITVVRLANVAPTVTITAPANNTPVSVPAVLGITASATDPDNPISRVDFFANGTLVASRTTAPYQIPLEILTAGPLTLTAQAVDIWGATGTSAPVVINLSGTVAAAPPASGRVLWLKADTGVSTNVDGTISVWKDQSAFGNDAVMDQIYFYPTPLLTNTLSGRPTLYYDGSLRYLLVTNAPSISLTNDLSMFFAGSFEDFLASRSICGKTLIAEPKPFDFYANTQGRVVAYRQDERGASAVASADPLPAGNFITAGVVYQGSQGLHYLNGIPNGSGSFSYGAIDGGMDLLIGTRDARDIYHKGELSELLLYDRALIGSDLQAMNTYLASRYNFALFRLYVQPPVLTATTTGPATIQLSWMPGLVGYVLESRPAVETGIWTTVATDPPNNQVTVGTTNAARFYRLRSQ